MYPDTPPPLHVMWTMSRPLGENRYRSFIFGAEKLKTFLNMS